MARGNLRSIFWGVKIADIQPGRLKFSGLIEFDMVLLMKPFFGFHGNFFKSLGTTIEKVVQTQPIKHSRFGLIPTNHLTGPCLDIVS